MAESLLFVVHIDAVSEASETTQEPSPNTILDSGLGNKASGDLVAGTVDDGNLLPDPELETRNPERDLSLQTPGSKLLNPKPKTQLINLRP